MKLWLSVKLVGKVLLKKQFEYIEHLRVEEDKKTQEREVYSRIKKSRGSIWAMSNRFLWGIPLAMLTRPPTVRFPRPARV